MEGKNKIYTIDSIHQDGAKTQTPFFLCAPSHLPMVAATVLGGN
jgi:hypothetical protein